eukprot:CAMPEP_0204843930 /NCGR_PEP_ID=MMETSP1346-20131115/48266_1 /ASSEMBLY_ACC=CAM_ASM_000771 /TAXON_ID=215587 /ORGANISM="Aplanochytrium stocchinoi, Strain GSBS06" /LENGTH=187 /DNA_ID=CAMNT_0051983153 /DNA_START=1092 /DNA_END=1655 /DNA_ORIENTATION=-
MRYRAMWEHDGPETVCVCDIHDDIDLLAQQICMMLSCMDRLGRDIGMTHWESDDDECLSSVALPLRGHFHVDGGICLWKKGDGTARKMAREKGSFKNYCASIVHESTVIPRGIDEMLVDAFLAASDVRERYAMFLPHKHKIREPDSVPDYGSDKDSYNSKSGYQTSTKTNESSDDKLEGTTLNIENH